MSWRASLRPRIRWGIIFNSCKAIPIFLFIYFKCWNELELSLFKTFGPRLWLRFNFRSVSRCAVTFSLSLYSDLSVVKTGGQPLLKFILRYLSRHSLNLSPSEKNKKTKQKKINLYSVVWLLLSLTNNFGQFSLTNFFPWWKKPITKQKLTYEDKSYDEMYLHFHH